MSADKLKARRTRRLFAAIVASSLALLVPGPLGTQSAGSTEPNLDHFQCWRSNFPDFERTPVRLTDQFSQSKSGTRVRVEHPKMLCAPVEKTFKGTTEIQQPDHHLTFYEHSPESFDPRFVDICNQFDCPRTVFVEKPIGLMVPTKKEGHDRPQGLDHYWCYSISDSQQINSQGGNGLQVQLEDQFKRRTATIHNPKELCNPAFKLHGDRFFDINNFNDHLVCYRTTEFEFSRRKRPEVNIRNQFGGDRDVRVRSTNRLCVPSFKQISNCNGPQLAATDPRGPC